MVVVTTPRDDRGPHAGPRLYSTCGLTLLSDFDLPLDAAPGARWDGMIRREPVPARFAGAIVERVAYQADRDRFVLEVRGIARYLAVEGRHIGVMPMGDGPMAAVTRFLQRDVIPALLLQRGVICLRASAVAGPRGAILLVGGPGLGKSSLAAALWRRGYGVIADNACALGRGHDGSIRALPEASSLDLWQDMVEHLGIDVAGCDTVRPGQSRFRIPVAPPAGPGTGLPIDQVFVLRRDNRTPPGLGDVRGLRKVEELSGALHHRALLHSFGLASDQVRMLVDLARQAPSSVLTRPAWPCRLAELADLVERRVAACRRAPPGGAAHARPSE